MTRQHWDYKRFLYARVKTTLEQMADRRSTPTLRRLRTILHPYQSQLEAAMERPRRKEPWTEPLLEHTLMEAEFYLLTKK